MFEAANGKLKVVGRAGVGVDNVDLEAATEVFGFCGQPKGTQIMHNICNGCQQYGISLASERMAVCS